MPGFTEEEVGEAVDRFLLKQVAVPRTKTGTRDVVVLRDRVYDLVTTALLLRPDSYFYVIYLAVNRLRALVQQQIAAVSSIQSQGPGASRPSKLVKSTTDLVSAQAALLDLSAGLNDRSTGVRGSLGPSVERFRRGISRFVTSELTKNVLVQGEITETAEELRASINSSWQSAIERHQEIVDLTGNLTSALASLAQVRLPESSIRDIVAKIQTRLSEIQTTMSGSQALAQSRISMLDLLAMRTLMAKASGFRNPEVNLMPKTGDTSLVSFLDSEGEEATILGTVSGPFNHDGAVLDLSVNGGASTPSVSLPGSTNATLRSRVLSPWVVPTTPAEAAFVVDHGATSSVAVAAWADGPTAAAALSSLTGMSVTWDAAESQLVFRSLSSGDVSYLRLLIDTTDRGTFQAWAFPFDQVVDIEASATPTSASDVVAAVAGASSLLRPSVVAQTYGSFAGDRTDVLGEEALLWNILDQGTDLVGDGTTTATSPSRSFQDLGIRPGMGLRTTAPGVVEAAIVAVNGPVLELDTALPAGVHTYYIGPDYRPVPVGTRVRVGSGVNRERSGFYRLLAGSIARVELDRDLPGSEAEEGLATTLFSEFVRISARGTTTSSGIGVLAPSTGATALGLTVSASESPASLRRVRLQGSGDFLLRGVRAGDHIDLVTPSGSGPTQYTIDLVEASDIYLVEAVPYEPGTWTYAIRSMRGASFLPIQATAGAFLVTDSVRRFADLDQAVSRLIRGSKFDGVVSTALADYQIDLQSLDSSLSTYAVPRERSIDLIVRTFREQGFDRALDLFLTLEMQELFSMDPDGVSYASWMVRKAATTAREVLPVSKFAKSDRVIDEWRTVSYQVDPFDPRGESDGRD